MNSRENQSRQRPDSFSVYLAPLIKNTAINTFAFGLVGVISLLLVPFLIGHYGIEAFGLIALVRYLMPKGILSILDLGIPECVTRQVAALGAQSDDRGVEEAIGAGTLILSVLGCLAALIFLLASAQLSGTSLKLNASQWGAMSQVFVWLAVSMLILFPGLAFEAALKGKEAFGVVRFVEVLGVLTYAGSAYVLANNDAEFQAIVLTFLAISAVQSLIFGIWVFCGIKGSRIRVDGISASTWKRFRRIAPPIFKSKVIGAIHGNAAPLILLPMAGAGAVGIYDALMKIPRFAKSFIGLVNSAVLPVSSRLEGVGKPNEMMAVVRHGTFLSFSMTAPPILFGIWYGIFIVKAWLGSEFGSFGIYLSLGLVWSLMISLIGFGVTMMIARPRALHQLNSISVVQVVLYLIVGTSLAFFAEAVGFIAALVITQTLVLVPQMALILREYRIHYSMFLRPITLTLLGLLPIIFVSILAPPLESLNAAVFVFAAWCVWLWSVLYLIGIDSIQKRRLRDWVLETYSRAYKSA